MAILVIGFGNTLRGDDGAGPVVAGRVGERRSDVRVVQVQQLTPELALDLTAASLAIFVDARVDEPERGVVGEEIGEADSTASTHHVTPGSLLLMARRLFGRAPRAYLVSLPSHAFGFSEQLSTVTAAAVDEAVGLVLELIEQE